MAIPMCMISLNQGMINKCNSLYTRQENMNQEENIIQKNIFEWAEGNLQNYPQLSLLKADASGLRLSIGNAVKAKRLGITKKGFPDLMLNASRGGYHALFIELKTEKGKVSKEQKEMLQKLWNEGNFTCVCRGFDATIKVITAYLEGKIETEVK